ncbi:MAG TPA: tetratricopeptide repeat protein, partial [Thermodesulfobacteriota bacterium]|nr:tetratricopeptide repeat protein [Thermodesulfobacteriota bacterium]
AAPGAAGPRLARSLARQAGFDLDGALADAEAAVRLDPDHAPAWARLAELKLAAGEVGAALRAAERAVRINPAYGRAHTVLGFARLADLDPGRATPAFERAIELEPADPLPRLGLGLTRIRQGDLEGGRRELETAVGLDPDRALLRSYLGKAYYEERRDEAAARELAAAKALDPHDPTPWFYDAIRKQSVNRPVEALEDLERAIALNDHRAVYRSRLLLDEDLAARSASLARIYDELGFEQRALAEAAHSLALDPTNFSAHRFLADTYADLPRHEIARVSEVLQSQLLQPLALQPFPPRLAASGLFIPEGTGPAEPVFPEFLPLFTRNRLALLASGVAGGNSTAGDEVTLGGLRGNVAYGLGQFHYETNGFRPNNDLREDIYALFVQARVSRATSLQAELRYDERERGDLLLRFDPEDFQPDLHLASHIRSARLGLRQGLGSASEGLVSVIYRSADFLTLLGEVFRSEQDEDSYTAEGQYLYRGRVISAVAGAGHVESDLKSRTVLVVPGIITLDETTRTAARHSNAYLYAHLGPHPTLVATAGLGFDTFRALERDRERDRVSPKLGLTWRPLAGTTVRAAVFRTVKRRLVTNQTIEPTQVAGFNQFFDDANGTEATRYGLGLDQKLSATLFAGAEASRRELEVPFLDLAADPPAVARTDWTEELARAYLYWAPRRWLALAAEYRYERFERARPLDEGISVAETHRVPLSARFFHRSGWRARVTTTPVRQRGVFADPDETLAFGKDSFWIVDAALGFRLPGRRGLISVEARNLFDETFRFQELDPANPEISPERVVLVRATLAF